MTQYWKAGVLAVGVGTHLLPADALKRHDESLITNRAAHYLSQRDAFDYVASAAKK